MNDDEYFYEPSEGHGLARDPINAIVAPRPIGWISSRDADGHLNLAPYSFFNVFAYRPPIIGFASGGRKDSVVNVEASGEFAWSLVTRPLVEAMNVTSATVPRDVDEFALAGLTPAPSRRISTPRVAESPASFECRVSQVVRLQTAAGVPLDTWLVLGEVIGVHIARALLVDGLYDTAAAAHVGRGGGSGDYFEIRADARFWLPRPNR